MSPKAILDGCVNLASTGVRFPDRSKSLCRLLKRIFTVMYIEYQTDPL
jgi:hypothetical protein